MHELDSAVAAAVLASCCEKEREPGWHTVVEGPGDLEPELGMAALSGEAAKYTNELWARNEGGVERCDNRARACSGVATSAYDLYDRVHFVIDFRQMSQMCAISCA